MSMSVVILYTEREAGGDVILVRKICRICGNASYSSSERGAWPCPYCNTNLAEERAMDAIAIETVQDFGLFVPNKGPKVFSTKWCDREDLNLHALASTRT